MHYQPIAASRSSGILITGTGLLISVGETRDVAVKRQESKGPGVLARCFTPAAMNEPEGGWPVLLYYHGGVWVLGNIDTENVVCTNFCARANCVVITTDYRYGSVAHVPHYRLPVFTHDVLDLRPRIRSRSR